MRHLYKFALFTALGASCAMAQQGQTPTTPPTFPGQQQTNPTRDTDRVPDQQTPPVNNPDQAGPISQTGTTSTTTLTQAQTHIQTALRQQLPASADSVSVGLSDDNKIQLRGTVSSEQEKQNIEQVARSAAPDQVIVNSLTVTNPVMSTPPAASTTGSSTSMGSATGEAAQRQSAGELPPPPSSGNTSIQTSPESQSAQTKARTGTQTGDNSGMNASSTTSVQSTIQTALQQDPTLSGANINVNVTDKNKVELTGTVSSKDQKTTAKRIAETNAGGLKVADHLKVEHGNNNAPPKY